MTHPSALPGLWAVVPAKTLHEGKSRLQPVLSGHERVTLSRRLLERTLKVALSIELFDAVVLVSPDPEALALAREAGALSLPEPAPGDLNRALAHAERWIEARGARAMITIFADLPWLEPEDLRAVAAAVPIEPGVAIAPDDADQGTNVMLRAPLGTVPFAYGPGSFQRHRDAARQVGVTPAIVRRPGLLFDVDSPDDLARLRASGTPVRPALAQAARSEQAPTSQWNETCKT